MANNKFVLKLEGKPYDIERRDGLVVVNGVEFSCGRKDAQFLISGSPHQVKLSPGQAEVDGISYPVEAVGLDEPRAARTARKTTSAGPAQAGALCAIMPGLIIKILKQEGDRVEVGETVLILEAMKMQNELQAKAAGVVKEMKVKQGENVEMQQVLCVIE
jgi:biotin carboxyl carrier protein